MANGKLLVTLASDSELLNDKAFTVAVNSGEQLELELFPGMP